ncbi:Coagulation factor 5/8 C-terminal domain [Trinorchestia longiramus]|nr:Coagulation factor 5/8 C-terminal domain [Trinorchestia longiramus]
MTCGCIDDYNYCPVDAEPFTELPSGYQVSDSRQGLFFLLYFFVEVDPRNLPGQSVTQCLHFLLIYEPSYSVACSGPLGLASGEILDWQISASSAYPSSWDAGCHMRYARLHQPNGRAWCSGRKVAGEWLLVDLGVPAKVTGILTQGKGDGKEWVTSYQVSYSMDAYVWHYVRDHYGDKKLFSGNTDSHTPRHNYIVPPVVARFMRMHALTWHSHPSMRLELLGCQECKQVVSEGVQVRVSASSHLSWRRRKSCEPHEVALLSHRAWCAKRKKRRGDSRRRHWVQSYTLTYSNDTVIWYTYKDTNHLDAKVFMGNLDKDTERRHYLNEAFTARYVRLNPKHWHQAIALRAALLGCPHEGDCGQRFFRVSLDTPCVENLAWSGRTWVNDIRHQWSGWHYGRAGLAVDGSLNTSLPRCAVLDNFSVDEPVWMVDLGTREDVKGIVVVTWQGDGQDNQTLYRDYVFGLDKLSAFVELRPRLTELPDNRECGTVTRLNNAVFSAILKYTASYRSYKFNNQAYEDHRLNKASLSGLCSHLAL